MKRSLTSIASLLTAAVTGIFASTPLTLDECLDSALRNNPLLKAADMTVEKYNILKGTAFNPSQTGIALTQEATAGDSPDNGLTFSQDFDFPTVYIARHKLLRAEASLETSRRDALRSKTLGDVATLYNNLLHAEKILSLLSEREALARESSRITRTRLENGETGNLDMLSAEDLCETAAIDIIEAERNAKAIARELASMSGFDIPVEPVGTLMPLPMPDMLMPSFGSTPAGRIAEASAEVDSRNVTMAKQSFMPGISLAATTKLFIKDFNPYNIDREPFSHGNFLKFEVGVSVPLFFFADRAGLRAARTEAKANALTRLDEMRAFENEWSVSRDRIVTLHATLERYRGSMLERATRMEQIADAAYKLGDISFDEYASRADRAIEVRIKIADLTNEYNNAVIAFNQMQGLL